MKRTFHLLLAAMTAIAVSGCAGPKRYLAQPDFGKRIMEVKRIGVVVPRVTVYRAGAGGEADPDPELCKEGKKCMEAGALMAFKERLLEASILDVDPDIELLLQTYESIHPNIRNHFPGGEQPVVKPVSFGDLEPLMERNGVDCLAIIYGIGYVSSAGRKTITAVLSLFTQRLAGVNAGSFSGGDADMVLIDRSGNLLFYGTRGQDGPNLTNEKHARNLIKWILDDLDRARANP